ncbi:MAG: hypothetical protein GTN78_03150, partial [Gemmatimonadales bacterium]|nr:hypothetical protein [Gemmatimonadales bacterium]
MQDEQPKSITANVFTWGCLILVAVVLSVSAFVVVMWTQEVRRNADLSAKLFEKQQQVASALIAVARLEGEVQAFRSVLVTPQRTAIEASLREFGQHVGGATGEKSVDDYAAWLDRSHR